MYPENKKVANKRRFTVYIYTSITGELHLTPLHAVVQMRPSFTYLDKADVKMKVEVGAGDGGIVSFQTVNLPHFLSYYTLQVSPLLLNI